MKQIIVILLLLIAFKVFPDNYVPVIPGYENANIEQINDIGLSHKATWNYSSLMYLASPKDKYILMATIVSWRPENDIYLYAANTNYIHNFIFNRDPILFFTPKKINEFKYKTSVVLYVILLDRTTIKGRLLPRFVLQGYKLPNRKIVKVEW